VSLVELLVATALGTVLILGLTDVLVSSKASYLREDQFARMQENGRFALGTLTEHVRSARSLDCGSLPMHASARSLRVKACELLDLADGTACARSTLDLFKDHMLDPERALGYDHNHIASSADLSDLPPAAAQSIFLRRLRGDVLVTWSAGPEAADVANVPALGGDGPLELAADVGLSEGSLAVISDCASADVFAVSAIEAGGKTIYHRTSRDGGKQAPSVNASAALRRAYNWRSEDTGGQREVAVPRYRARVSPFHYRAYYVCCIDGAAGRLQVGDERHNCAASPDRYRPSLCMWELGADSQSLVSDVADLRVTYTGDLNGDWQPDFFAHDEEPVPTPAWVSLNDAWAGVSAARIELLIASAQSNLRQSSGAVPPAKASWPPAGDHSDRLGSDLAADRRLYHRFVANVALRSRTPWYLQ